MILGKHRFHKDVQMAKMIFVLAGQKISRSDTIWNKSVVPLNID